MGQTLSITVDNTDYLLVLGGAEILLYRDDVENAMLVYETALAYSSSEITKHNRNSVPRRLLKSSRLGGSFFLLSEGGPPVLLELDIYSGVHEIYSPQPISDTVRTSIVAQALGQDYRDDVFVMVVDNSTLRLYSVLDNEYKGTIGVAQHCDQVTRLHNLPPAANDSRISFAVRCTKDGQDMLYYAVVTYRYSQSLDSVHPLNVGVPVATTTHLSVRHGNQVTIYERSDMDHGVPRPYTASSQVKRVVGFETNGKSYFLVFTANESVTLIDPDLFGNNWPQGTSSIPGTMQGLCDPCLPYAIVDDGILLSAQGELNTFDIVTLAHDPVRSTLSEVARVQGIPDTPALVRFISTPNPTTEPPPTAQPTIEPTTSPTTQPTAPPTAEPSTKARSTLTSTGSMRVPQASTALTVEETIVIIAVVMFVLISVVTVVAIVICVTCVVRHKNQKKKQEEVVITSPKDDTQGAPSYNNRYPQPIAETGDLGNDEVRITIQPESASSDWTEAVQANDPGYNSAKQTPEPSRLNIQDRLTESRQSTNSVGTVSTDTGISTEGESIGVPVETSM